MSENIVSFKIEKIVRGELFLVTDGRFCMGCEYNGRLCNPYTTPNVETESRIINIGVALNRGEEMPCGLKQIILREEMV